MEASQKTYPGKFPRPTVEMEVHSGQNMIIVTTPWGTREATRHVSELIRDFCAAALSDPEATSPFARLPGLSPTANNLRISALLANESVFRKFNGTRYEAACELLVLAVNNRELSWVQVGQPNLLLVRNGELEPLQVGHDLGFDYACPTPLAGRLMGLDKQLELESRSIITKPGDKLVLLSRSHISRDTYLPDYSGMSAEQIAGIIFDANAKNEPDLPFWVGAVAL
jgi:hypothetical protein